MFFVYFLVVFLCPVCRVYKIRKPTKPKNLNTFLKTLGFYQPCQLLTHTLLLSTLLITLYWVHTCTYVYVSAAYDFA